MQWSDERNEIAAALAEFTGKVGPVAKTKTGKISGKSKATGNDYSYEYGYADLSDQREHVRETLTACGLTVTQSVGSDGQQVAIETLLLHKSGQWISSDVLLIPTDGSAQAQGSAMTYGRRYQYQAILGLAAEDDDDGKAATERAATGTAASRKSGGASEAQVKTIWAVAKAIGWDHDKLIAALEAKYGPGAHPDTLTKSQASHIIEGLKKREAELKAIAELGATEETAEEVTW